MPPQHVIDEVNRQGGAVFLAHPHWSSINVMRDVLPLTGFAGIEGTYKTRAGRTKVLSGTGIRRFPAGSLISGDDMAIASETKGSPYVNVLGLHEVRKGGGGRVAIYGDRLARAV